MRLLVVALITAASFACTGQSNAQTTLLTYFNFNDSNTSEDLPPGGTAGNGDLLASSIIASPTNGVSGFGFNAGTTLNAVGTDAAGQALTVTGSGNNNRSFEFTLNTTTFSSLSLSYATRRTSTGFTTQTLSYSTNGVDFTTFGTFTAFDSTNFTLASFNLPSAANSQPTLTVRFTLSGASSTSGLNNFDNIQVTGVPEPATTAAGFLAFGALCCHQRRRLGALTRSLMS